MKKMRISDEKLSMEKIECKQNEEKRKSLDRKIKSGSS